MVSVKRGFTLIELLVALAVIALLLSIVTPRYFGSVSKTEEAVLKENLHVMRDALDKHFADAGRYPDALADLVAKHYLRNIPNDPSRRAAPPVVLPPADPQKGAVFDVKAARRRRQTKPYGSALLGSGVHHLLAISLSRSPPPARRDRRGLVPCAPAREERELLSLATASARRSGSTNSAGAVKRYRRRSRICWRTSVTSACSATSENPCRSLHRRFSMGTIAPGGGSWAGQPPDRQPINRRLRGVGQGLRRKLAIFGLRFVYEPAEGGVTVCRCAGFTCPRQDGAG
jgi:general secretion pathway protein G